MTLLGIDLGGTKCVAVLAEINKGSEPVILWKSEKHMTPLYSPPEMLSVLAGDIKSCLSASEYEFPAGIGISCGGPLDSRKGIILSPPNMKAWDQIHVTEYFENAFSIPCHLCNDANAGALAEWKWGAGKGSNNLVFLTFGTGMGAGLILNGALYAGQCDMAGEIGHIRLSASGPAGYGKLGSFEGFCSGGGIAQLASSMIEAERQKGNFSGIASKEYTHDRITAETVGMATDNGDPLAISILAECGRYLGYGLSVIIDILNPEKIIIGSIFARCRQWLWPAAEKIIKQESLPQSYASCSIIPASLGEKIGDFAAIAVAYENLDKGSL